jgi:thiamine pyrophosphate-dependent acetolactate synthase large subunit-like protein
MFRWPDLAGVATALGGVGVSAGSMAELDVALKSIAGRDRPALIDVRLDPDSIGSTHG